MKRVFLILAITALAMPTTALAKGPSGASISGPGDGGGGGITFTGNGEDGGTPLGDLTQQAGFFPAAFGQEPDPMLPNRPTGDLGPKYTITYTVPNPNNGTDKLRQAVYPYAANGPVTYMEPGQKFFVTERTHGGWFQADSALKETLVSAGLPAKAPTGGGESSSLPTMSIVSLVGAALLILAATALVLRRRARPAAA
jgi:hypothetical protein